MSYFNLFVSPLQDFVDKRKEMSKTSLNYGVSKFSRGLEFRGQSGGQ
jgi:hypothetical protein